MGCWFSYISANLLQITAHLLIVYTKNLTTPTLIWSNKLHVTLYLQWKLLYLHAKLM